MPDYEEHIVVDVAGQRTENAGGAMSSRWPVKYLNEDGTEVRGYFTETSRIRSGEVAFTEEIEDIAEKYPQFAGFFHLLGEMPFQSYAEIVLREKNRPTAKLDDRLDRKSKNYSGKAVHNRWGRALREAEIPEAEFEKAWQDPDFQDSLSDLSKRIHMAYSSGAYQIGHGQRECDNINRRNNAMYEVAGLMGLEGLIAPSVNMTIVAGDKVKHGTFMLNAKGYDRDDLNPFTHPELAGRSMVVTVGAVKKLVDLQTLDYLCGNVDRHGGNFMYQFDFSNPRGILLTGIQGIDNDFSFVDTNKLENGRHQYLVDVYDFGAMNRDTAERIMNLDKNEFRRIMTRAGVNKDEMKAAEDRLARLQGGLISGNIAMVDDSFWTQKSLRELAECSALFANIRKTLDLQWNRKILHFNEEHMRQFYPQRFKERPEIEAGINRSETDRYHLLNGAARLREIKKALDDNTPEGRQNGDEYNKMMSAMEHVIRLSEEGAGQKDGPGDYLYNELTEAYRRLGETAETYERTHGGFHRAMGALRLEKSKELSLLAAEQEHAANEASVRALNAKLKAEAEFIHAGGLEKVLRVTEEKIAERKTSLQELLNAHEQNDDELSAVCCELLVYKMATIQLKANPEADHRNINALSNNKIIAQMAKNIQQSSIFTDWYADLTNEQLQRFASEDGFIEKETRTLMHQLSATQTKEKQAGKAEKAGKLQPDGGLQVERRDNMSHESLSRSNPHIG